MVKKITLTEDHLKLIPFLFIQEFDDDKIGVSTANTYCLGSHLLEDMAMILGLTDKAIPNTQDDADGTAYDDDTEKYMLSIHEYIVGHLADIEQLVHQFVVKGGLTPGTYKALDNVNIWEKE